MKKLRVAVIGCGRISLMHLQAARDLEEAELVAVCDIKPEVADAAAQKYNVTAYYDYKEMFEKEELDAVHLCLPHHIHTRVSQDAMRAGIHVLCEKPMSIEYEDAEKTVLLAKELKMQYGIIFQCRYAAPVRAVRQCALDGKLGKVKSARVILTWYRPDNYYDGSDWKGTWEKEGGGVVVNQAIHSLDLANWIINDEPVEIQASLHNRNHKSMAVEDCAEGQIIYKDGASLSFYAMNNYGINEPIEIKFVCENAKVTLSYDEAKIVYNNGETQEITNDTQDFVKYSGGKDYWGSQHAVQIRQFYRAVLGLEPLEISGEEALKIQKIICEIYKTGKAKM